MNVKHQIAWSTSAILFAGVMAAAAVNAETVSGGPDAVTFITGGDLGSTAILSINANSPDTVFEGVSLDDYEPAYAYFNRHTAGGDKWSVCQDLEREVLRPYNVVRATENGATTMTVQFQGVTRMHTSPYTASITIKFMQSGDNVVAYVVRAASLKPLDIELGLDLDAMVASRNPRAISRPLTGDGKYNISFIAMRKSAATVAYTPYKGDTISDTLDGNGAISVTRKVDETTYSGYLPGDGWTVVAANHNLRDLDEVEGFLHWKYREETGCYQTAYNLKYSIISDRANNKTCQFQHDLAGSYICALIVEFRQNGANVEARSGAYYSHYIAKSGYESEVVLGMDFEVYGTSTSPQRLNYGTYATDDSTNAQGVKDLKLKFNVYDRANYLPYLQEGWTDIAPSRNVNDLAEIDAHHHWKYTYANGVGDCYKTAMHLKTSLVDSGYKTFQIQRDQGSLLECLYVRLYQSGGNIRAWLNNWNYNLYLQSSGVKFKYGIDFEEYLTGTKTPSPTHYQNIATSDDANGDGMKDVLLKFVRGEYVTYAAASTALYGNDLTFSGSADAPLDVRTSASTVFPSNGVVKVEPYATLTLAGHVENGMWTQYRVMTNGTLAITGTWQTSDYDQIDLVGGTLSIRECDTAGNDSGSYINYVTLMNGACVKGKVARVGHAAQGGNWIVAGDSPSYCESGIEFTAAGGDIERTFVLNVNDVAEGSDFIVTGDLADYGTLQSDSGYWNVHVIKDGAGTMEVSGDIKLPNEISVSNGVLRLAETCTFSVSRRRSTENGDGSNAKAQIWLAGGELETAAGATNEIGKVVAKVADAPLNLGDGSKLTLSAFEFERGANLLVSDNLGDGAKLHVEGAPTGKVVRGIRCGADRKSVIVDESGNLVPWCGGLSVIIR